MIYFAIAITYVKQTILHHIDIKHLPMAVTNLALLLNRHCLISFAIVIGQKTVKQSVRQCPSPY